MARFRQILRNRNFFLLWLGQIISQLGDRLDQMALIGLISSRLPGKGLHLATLLTFTILPVFVIGPLAGVYVDRWDRRKTMYICDFLRAVLVLLIPILIIDRNKSLIWLYLLVFLSFSIARFFVPAKMAIVPDIVDNSQLLLANSLINTTGMIAATLGFAIGGIIVAVLGVKGGFYLDALSFCVSSLLIFFVRYKRKSQVGIVEVGREIVDVIRKSVLTEVKEGIKYLFGQKQMRIAVDVLFLLWAALGSVYVVLIVFVQKSLQSLTLDLGLLITFLGAGLFCGSLIYGRFGRKENYLAAIFLSLLVSGLVLSGFAFTLERSPYFYTAAILSFIFGVVVSPIMTAVNTLIHEVSTETMRGKVFSSIELVMHLAFVLFMFLGSGISGLKYIGESAFLMGIGVLVAFIGLISYLNFRLKEKINVKTA